MLFAITAMDKPCSGALRQATRAAHFDYVHATAKVRLGGPFLDAAGNMIGSLIILEAADRAEAEEWARNDPYAQAGLFESSTLEPWKATANFCGAEL